MVPFNYPEFIDGLIFHVKNYNIPISRINDAVKRILRVKFVMGLFENPLANTSLAKEIGSQVSQYNPRKGRPLKKNKKELIAIFPENITGT